MLLGDLERVWILTFSAPRKKFFKLNLKGKWPLVGDQKLNSRALKGAACCLEDPGLLKGVASFSRRTRDTFKGEVCVSGRAFGPF